MRFSRAVNVVDAHAEGESGKVVVGGIGPVPGRSVFDKKRCFEERLFRTSHSSAAGSTPVSSPPPRSDRDRTTPSYPASPGAP